MAAPLQPARPTLLRALALCAGVVGALAVPVDARAHPSAPVVALDFRASVDRTPRGLAAKVIDGDRLLELRLTAARRVVVLGYGGEPFLRFDAAGVFVNRRSPTAVADRLAGAGAVPALAPSAAPVWVRQTSGTTFRWHDHRLGHVPDRAYPDGDAGAWVVPVVVDGTRSSVRGRLEHAGGPSLWPWLALLGLTAGLCAALARTRSVRAVESVALGGSLAAAAAGLTLSIAVALASGRTSASAWGSVSFAALIALGGACVLLVGRPLRVALAGVVALFAGLSSLSYAAVLVHGFVVAALPAGAIRALAVTAVVAGSAAVVATASYFLSVDARSLRRRVAAGARS